jgi:hypothetical protein
MGMSAQTICQIVVGIGALISLIGTFGSYHFGKKEQAVQRRATEAAQAAVTMQLASISRNTELLVQAANVKPDVWTEVEMKNVPPGVTDYLLLLFVADKGRISGKVRIRGAERTSLFSTTANSRVPVAVPNLWLPDQKSYKVPTILEFAVTEKTEPDAALTIFTQGWIDSRGTEPH